MTNNSNAEPNAPLCRLATHADYDSVVNMRFVYDGRDYIPSRFHNYIDDRTRRLAVAIVNGQVVSFLMIQLVDSGEGAIWEAGRTREGHERANYQTQLRQFMRDYLNQLPLRPSWMLVVTQSPKHFEPNTLAIALWFANQYTPTFGHVKTGISRLLAGVEGLQLDRCRCLTSTEAIGLLSNDAFWTTFCPSGFWTYDNEYFRKDLNNFQHIFCELVDPPLAVITSGDAGASAFSISVCFACAAGMYMRVNFYAPTSCQFAAASALLQLHFLKHLVARAQRGWLVYQPLGQTKAEFHYRCTLSNNHNYDNELIDDFRSFARRHFGAIDVPQNNQIYMFRFQ